MLKHLKNKIANLDFENKATTQANLSDLEGNQATQKSTSLQMGPGTSK